MRYLFLLTIGPVQSFIAQARKTQDLYAGSRLLSELCRIGIEEFEEKGGNVIFPNKKNQSLPNRFLAEIEVDSAEKARELGNHIETYIQGRFLEIARFTANQLRVEKTEAFMTQLEKHLSISWTFSPYEEDYGKAYLAIEKELGAVKNTRSFQQLSETGRKCSLSGEYNALFYGSQYNLPSGVKASEVQKVDTIHLNAGEGLSAVAFVKRFFKFDEDKVFPATADISAYDFIENVDKGKLKDYQSLFKKDFNGQLLYDESLTPNYFWKKGLLKHLSHGRSSTNMMNKGISFNQYTKDKLIIQPLEEDLTAIKNKLKELKKTANGHKLNSYYALLIFDGDSMGEWLSGQKLVDKSKLKEYHNFITTLLGDFASWADKELKAPYGKVIYAGGDDFLGILNLRYVLDVYVKLRVEFENRVSKPLLENFSFKSGDTLTFSAGIAIAHYKDPLADTLNFARKMEKVAKSIDDKDALSMAVVKHSGEIHHFSCQWLDGEFMKSYQAVLKMFDTGLSAAFITSISQELKSLYFSSEDDEFFGKSLEKILKVELKRLIKKSDTDLCKIDLEEAVNHLYKLYRYSKKVGCNAVDNYIYMLQVLDFLRRNR